MSQTFRRLASAVVHERGLRGLSSLAGDWFRYPEYTLAYRRLVALPSVPLAELVDPVGLGDVSARTLLEPRLSWTLGPLEQLALTAIAADRNVRKVLEIGTFEGATTSLLAEVVGPSGSVVTMDLPSEDLARYDLPEGFTPDDVGRAYREAGLSDRVHQLKIDSSNVSPASLSGEFDLVFIDAFHDYAHGRSDTELALAVVAKDGVVIFDDFDPHWAGLILGVTEAAEGRDLRVINGTRLAILFP